MKIEKLTENKIRIIINQDEFKHQNIDFNSFFLKNFESQDLFLKILTQAKREVDFDVEGCKLLIETFSSSEDILIFTITKYIESDFESTKGVNKKKVLSVKKKYDKSNHDFEILQFDNFEDFCNLCEIISKSKINIKNICKNNSLYYYNNTYYLLIENINNSSSNIKAFNNLIIEFSNILPCSRNFGIKLKEHAKIIIKKNAIDIGIENFIN